MGIFSGFKKLEKQDGYIDKDGRYHGNIYKELGMIEPFTVFIDHQFAHFLQLLAKSELLNESERKAFDTLWWRACFDVGNEGRGSRIWELKTGTFAIYDKDGVYVRYEKKESELDKDTYYPDGRANFVYLSNDGNIIINQSERNKKVFLIYVSTDISNRLLQALRNAECKALDIKEVKQQSDQTFDIPADYTPLLDKATGVPEDKSDIPEDDRSRSGRRR